MTIAQLVECQPDAARLRHQLRLIRLKLGAAIEQLEQCELSPTALEQVQCNVAGVGCEIDLLLASVRSQCC